MKKIHGSLKADIRTLVIAADNDANGKSISCKYHIEVLSRCDAKIPHFNLVFNEDVLLKVVVTSVMRTIEMDA